MMAIGAGVRFPAGGRDPPTTQGVSRGYRAVGRLCKFGDLR
jgi:hypothetical protein